MSDGVMMQRAVKPLPSKRKQEKESPVGAAIRRRLLELIERPLIARNVQDIQGIASAAAGFLQATGVGAAGLPRTRRLKFVGAEYGQGISTPFGVVPLLDSDELYGRRLDSAPTLFSTLRAMVNKTRLGAMGLVWRLGAGKPEDREPEFAGELRAKLREILAQPMTTRNAVAFSRVVDAVLPLVQISGQAKARRSLGAYTDGFMPIGGPSYDDMMDDWADAAGLVGEPAMAPNPVQEPVVEPASDAGTAETPDAAQPSPLEYDDMAGFAGGFMPYAPASSRENFGAKAMREILAALPKILGAKTRSPTELVRAIGEAERAGMPKLAAKLREQLGVREPNEGEKPIAATPEKHVSEVEQRIGLVENAALGGLLGVVSDGDDETAVDVGVSAFAAAATALSPDRLAPAIASAMSSVAAEIDEVDREGSGGPSGAKSGVLVLSGASEEVTK